MYEYSLEAVIFKLRSCSIIEHRNEQTIPPTKIKENNKGHKRKRFSNRMVNLIEFFKYHYFA